MAFTKLVFPVPGGPYNSNTRRCGKPGMANLPERLSKDVISYISFYFCGKKRELNVLSSESK